jgi:hypothetical protein
MTEFSFSISEHTTYLAGYMDAVGRTLSSDRELICFSSNLLADPDALEGLLGPVVIERPVTGGWSSEFGPLLKGHFGIDEQSRLGFYLVEYIDWFHQFTNNVECIKIICQRPSLVTLFEAVYLLQWNTGERVVLSFTRNQKTQPE